jgi:phage baseplate assembly protein W
MIGIDLMLDKSSLRVGEEWFDWSADSNSDMEILQCVAQLFATVPGDVVLDRAIGVDQSYIDKPINMAVPIVLQQFPAALQAYEPRAKLVNITYDKDQSKPADGQSVIHFELARA